MTELTRRPLGVTRRTLLASSCTAGITASFSKQLKAAPAKTMRYMVAAWADGMAITYVAAELLEQKYAYKVDVAQTDVAIAYVSLAQGKGDVWSLGFFQGEDEPMHGIFKGGHANYMEKIAGKVDVLGLTDGPMQIGFGVPDYVDAKTPDDLNKYADKFNNQIIGIDPGSGLMQAADRAVAEYGLKLKLLPGSEAAMMASLKRAIDKKEWIVVTAYSPHPMFTLGLKYIEDPKKVFGKEPLYFFTLSRKGFADDFPEAAAFFRKYRLPNDATAQIMAWEDAGMQPRDAAAKWINENHDKPLIQGWLS
jgi:glycine betaine/proline transport system substrate-binding protein